jgi:hypothetical protein
MVTRQLIRCIVRRCGSPQKWGVSGAFTASMPQTRMHWSQIGSCLYWSTPSLAKKCDPQMQCSTLREHGFSTPWCITFWQASLLPEPQSGTFKHSSLAHFHSRYTLLAPQREFLLICHALPNPNDPPNQAPSDYQRVRNLMARVAAKKVCLCLFVCLFCMFGLCVCLCIWCLHVVVVCSRFSI